MGFEPTASTLARLRSTPELHSLIFLYIFETELSVIIINKSSMFYLKIVK